MNSYEFDMMVVSCKEDIYKHVDTIIRGYLDNIGDFNEKMKFLNEVLRPTSYIGEYVNILNDVVYKINEELESNNKDMIYCIKCDRFYNISDLEVKEARNKIVDSLGLDSSSYAICRNCGIHMPIID